MTNTHKIRMLACWLAIPSILVACSASPPKYHLDNDACSVVNASAFATLTDSNQPLTSEPSKLKDGLQGGNCEMRFVGPTGEVTLTTFIAIHSNEQAAAKMYNEFHTAKVKRAATHDMGAAANQTVTEPADLGTAAYLYREYYDSGEWKPTSTWLYELSVQHGTLVLALTATGFAKKNDRRSYNWPALEQGLKKQIQDTLEQSMEKLAQ